jgi:hypothetical protein
VDTLAFDYRIPIITAPSGLSPFGNEACPAHQSHRFSEALAGNRKLFYNQTASLKL